MRRVMSVFLVCLLAGSALLADDSARVERELDGVLVEITEFLSARGFEYDIQAARHEAGEVLLRQYDPAAQLVVMDEVASMKEVQQGLVYSVPLDVEITNAYPHVISVEESSSLANAGLQAGDVIEAVNGEDIANWSLTKLRRELVGLRDESVHLVVRAGEEEPTRDLEVARSLVQLESIEHVEKLPFDLAYLQLNGLYEGSGTLIVRQLREWAQEGLFGVILDLRGANGMDLKSAADIGSLFAPIDTELFTMQTPNGEAVETYKSTSTIPLGMPAMIIVDHDTTGSPEILAALLANSVEGAMLIGTETRADPCVREIVSITEGESIYVMMRKLVTSNGTEFDGKTGVKPNIVLSADQMEDHTYIPAKTSLLDRDLSEDDKAQKALRDRIAGDLAMRRAADILLGLKALNIRGATHAAAAEGQ